MTIRDYLIVARRRWVVVAITTLVLTLAFAITGVVQPRVYVAETTMYVSAQTGETTQSAYQGAQLSQQRVASYTELVTSPRVTDRVAERLNLTVSGSELASSISASNATQSVLILISVQYNDPKIAAEIANSVAFELSALVDELERPNSPTGVAPVSLRQVQIATAPEISSETPIPALVGIGVIVGLAIGLAAAVLREKTDVSITRPDALANLVGVPSLGEIPLAGSSESALAIKEAPKGIAAESYRKLRTNISFVGLEQQNRAFIVTSSLPGEGKSTTTANLGIALSSVGSRVLLIEADLRRPALSEILGLDRSVGLTTVLSGRSNLSRAIQPWAGGPLEILSSGQIPPNPSELLASSVMKRLLDDVRQRYDYILIDTPPLIPVTDASALAPHTDGVILLCRYRETPAGVVSAATKSVRSAGSIVVGTVLTMSRNNNRPDSQYQSYYSLQEDSKS